MPPRKSNVSAISATNEDGTPSKEPRDGVNIEVNPPSHLPPGNVSQLGRLPRREPCKSPPSRRWDLCPKPTPATSIPYILNPPPSFPYNAHPPEASTQQSLAGSYPGFPGPPLEHISEYNQANASGYLPQGPPGSLGPAGPVVPSGPFDPADPPAPLFCLYPLEQSLLNSPHQPNVAADPFYERPKKTTNNLNTSADRRIIVPPQDLSLPKTMVQRLAKGVLPPNTQIQKDAILAMQKGATMFVNHLAAAANATAQTNNRRTIPPPAIFEALEELEFDFMSDWVSKELNKFNDTNAGKRNEYRRKLKEEERLKKEQEGGPKGDDDGDDIDEERAIKRARMGDEEYEEEGPEGSMRTNGHANGRESPTDGHDGGDEDDPIDLDENEEDEGNENEGEGQEEPEEEEEEEEEEDDEDEFPDEGRRASSVEAETYPESEDRTRRSDKDDEDESMNDDHSE